MFNFMLFKLSKTCKEKGFASVLISTKKANICGGVFQLQKLRKERYSLSLLRLSLIL